MFSRHLLSFAFLMTALPAFAVTLGDDGLHKTDWMRETFLDLREDLEEANAEGKRLMVMIEQRGCIYCTKMHEDVYPDPEITATIEETYFVVQLNLYGDREVVDFDGSVMSEKDLARSWNAMFTPMVMFFPSEVAEGVTGNDAAVAVVPGAFGRGTTLDMLTWVRDEGYLGDEAFQRYHARKIEERIAAQ